MNSKEFLETAEGVSARRLLGLVRPYWRTLSVATVFMLVGGAISLATPLVAGRVVDAATVDGSVEKLNVVAVALVSLFGLMAILYFAEFYLLRATGARLLRGLRVRLFSHLLELPPLFYDQRPVGELLSRLSSDLTVMQTALTQQIPSGLEALLRFVGTLVILLVLQTRLTLVSLLVVPPVVLMALFYGRRLERLATAEQDAVADATAQAEEALAGIRTVQAFGREHDERSRYRLSLAELLHVQLRNARVGGAFSALIQFAAFTAVAIVLWYGGRLMLRGMLTPGQLTAFLLYNFSIAVSIGTLGSLYASYRGLKGASARIFHILDHAEPVQQSSDPLELVDVRGAVEFKDLHFSYDAEVEDADSASLQAARPALAGLSLSVEPGEVIGLVGPSGAGKSTVFSLLLRFYEAQSGSISIDGHELRDLSLASLRRATGIVPQEIFLFSGSIADNIRYGRPGADDAAVRAAAAAAGAAEFIEALPAGYDELTGQRGVRLSAGQRQRIAIARAFLKDPAILLLDEATSSLDPDSEDRVQRALEGLMTDRTTFVIAHRLATARRANRIIVLDEGRVVGAGSHDQLFESNELYRRYWELQSLRHGEKGGS